MIDLHCHMLPGIDDGAKDLDIALQMARIAAADGVAVTACTPHIYPGMFENDTAGIQTAIDALQAELDREGIALRLTIGADAHVSPDLLARLKAGTVPTLGNNTRYFLLEPPHHVAPPRFDEFVFNLLAAGYVPVVTHPERLSWIETHYGLFRDLVRQGAWMQVTAGSLVGKFGAGAQAWGERMLADGLVHILASDGHSVRGRPPAMAAGRDAAARIVGVTEASNLVETRPAGILKNCSPSELPPLPEGNPGRRRGGWFGRLFGRRSAP